MANTETREATLGWRDSTHPGSPLRPRPWLAPAAMMLAVLACLTILQAVDTVLPYRAEFADSRVRNPYARSGANENGNASSKRVEIDAALAWLDSLQLRRVIVCRSDDIVDTPAAPGMTIASRRCDGSAARVESAAREIARSEPQAVVFDGTTRDAVLFVETLRARGSFAMVVVTPAVNARELATTIRASARTWLAAEQRAESGSSDSKAVRIGILTARGSIVH